MKKPSNLSLSLEEEEIQFLHDLRRLKQQQESRKPKSNIKTPFEGNTYCDAISVVDEFVHIPQTTNCNKEVTAYICESILVENTEEAQNKCKTKNVTIKEHAELDMSLNEDYQLQNISKDAHIYTKRKEIDDHISMEIDSFSQSLQNIQLQAAPKLDVLKETENFDRKLKNLSLKSSSNESINLEVEFPKSVRKTIVAEQQMDISINSVVANKRNTIHCNENILSDENTYNELTNSMLKNKTQKNKRKTIIYKDKDKENDLNFTTVNRADEHKSANNVKSTLTAATTGCAMKNGIVVVRKGLKSSLIAQTGKARADLEKLRFQRKQKNEQLQNQELNKNIAENAKSPQKVVDNAVKTFNDDDISLQPIFSSPLFSPDCIGNANVNCNLRQLNEDLERGKIELYGYTIINQDNERFAGRRLFTPAKKDKQPYIFKKSIEPSKEDLLQDFELEMKGICSNINTVKCNTSLTLNEPNYAKEAEPFSYKTAINSENCRTDRPDNFTGNFKCNIAAQEKQLTLKAEFKKKSTYDNNRNENEFRTKNMENSDNVMQVSPIKSARECKENQNKENSFYCNRTSLQTHRYELNKHSENLIDNSMQLLNHRNSKETTERSSQPKSICFVEHCNIEEKEQKISAELTNNTNAKDKNRQTIYFSNDSNLELDNEKQQQEQHPSVKLNRNNNAKDENRQTIYFSNDLELHNDKQQQEQHLSVKNNNEKEKNRQTIYFSVEPNLEIEKEKEQQQQQQYTTVKTIYSNSGKEKNRQTIYFSDEPNLELESEKVHAPMSSTKYLFENINEQPTNTTSKTNHTQCNYYTSEAVRVLSETQYLIEDIIDVDTKSPPVLLPKKLKNNVLERQTIYFADEINLDSETNSKIHQFAQQNTNNLQKPSLSETQYLIEDIVEIDTNSPPYALLSHLKSNKLEQKTIYYADKCNLDIENNDKISEMENNVLVHAKDTVATQNELCRQIAYTDHANLLEANKFNEGKKSKNKVSVSSETYPLAASINESYTVSPKTALTPKKTRLNCQRRSIHFADEQMEIENDSNNIEVYASPAENIRTKLPRNTWVETPHRSVIEFENLERECAQADTMQFIINKNLKRNCTKDKNDKKRVTSYAIEELEVSGVQPLEVEDISEMHKSPVFLKKRLTANLTPNLPFPKKRQTIMYDDCDLEDTSHVAPLQQNLLKRQTIVFSNDISIETESNAKNNKDTNLDLQHTNGQNDTNAMDICNESDANHVPSTASSDNLEMKAAVKKNVIADAELIENLNETDDERNVDLKNTSNSLKAVISICNESEIGEMEAENIAVSKHTAAAHSSNMNISVLAAEETINVATKATPLERSRIPVLIDSAVKKKKINNCTQTDNKLENSNINHSMETIQIIRRADCVRKDSIFELLADTSVVPESSKVLDANTLLEDNAITITDLDTSHDLRKHKQNKSFNDAKAVAEALDEVQLSLVETLLDEHTDNKIEVADECVQVNFNKDTCKSSLCRKCKNCHETLDSDATIFVDSFVLPEAPPLPTMERLKKLRLRPTLDDVIEYNRRVSLEQSLDIENLSIISADDEDDESDEAADIINAYKQQMESFEKKCVQIAKSKKVQKSFVQRLDSKLNANANNWIFNYQSQYINVLQFNHKKITTFCIMLTYEEHEKFGDVNISTIAIELSRVPKKNWLPIDYIMHFQLKLELPFDLQFWCDSSDEYGVLNMLEKVDIACNEVSEMAYKLWKMIFKHKATLIRVENKIYVRKIVRRLKTADKYARVDKSEFRIEITNIRNLSFKDIVYPPLYTFSDEIQNLPNGLDFLNEFLYNPVKHLKSNT